MTGDDLRAELRSAVRRAVGNAPGVGRVVGRWSRWRLRRRMSAWQRGLPEHVIIVAADDWAREPVGSVIDVASWTMPLRSEWPMAWPVDGFGPRRVEPEPRGPRSVRLVAKSPDGSLVAYEVIS